VPEGEAEAVGAWMALQGGQYANYSVWPDQSQWSGAAGSLVLCPNRDPASKVHPGTWPEYIVEALASSLRWPPVQVVEGDVCGVEPREVARWAILQQWSVANKGPDAGFDGPGRDRGSWDNPGWDKLLERPRIAQKFDAVPSWPPTVISNAPVEQVQPGTLPPGTVVYFDPPYFGDGYRKITGYKHTLSRDQVVLVAKRWSDAGATVAVSECVPIRELEGWHFVDISGERVGQKRTFSSEKSEWLTVNKEPKWTPSVQAGLDFNR
jgi:hypothetical protein